MAKQGDITVINAQRLTLGSHVSVKAMFSIRVKALGEVDVTVDAVSADASESLVWKVLVKVQQLILNSKLPKEKVVWHYCCAV